MTVSLTALSIYVLQPFHLSKIVSWLRGRGTPWTGHQSIFGVTTRPLHTGVTIHPKMHVSTGETGEEA